MTKSNDQNQAIVMVRAAGMEPVRLRAIESSSSYVRVAELGGSASIYFPASDVFRFDDALFGQLKGAYGDGDFAKLSQLWNLAHGY